MKKLVIFGLKNFADMAHYLFSHESEYSVEAFCVDGAYIDRPAYRGLPVIAWEELQVEFSPEDYEIFVAIGIEKVNQLRAMKIAEIREKGYKLANFISPRTRVPDDFTIRENSMIMDNVGLHPFVEIGENTIVWSFSRIALKTRIGAHCWVTSAILGESVNVDDYTFIGLNATIAPTVSVGKSNIIGAGALIMKDTNDYAVYKGPVSRASEISSTNPLWKL